MTAAAVMATMSRTWTAFSVDDPERTVRITAR
jgi:hypothetical protein